MSTAQTLFVILVILLLIPFEVYAQIYYQNMVTTTSIQIGNLLTKVRCQVTLNGTGTVDIGSATGDLVVQAVVPFIKAAPSSVLTTTALVTDEAVPKNLLSATVHTSLVVGANLTAFSNWFTLGDGKKIQRVNAVASGTGGGLMYVDIVHFKGDGSFSCVSAP